MSQPELPIIIHYVEDVRPYPRKGVVVEYDEDSGAPGANESYLMELFQKHDLTSNPGSFADGLPLRNLKVVKNGGDIARNHMLSILAADRRVSLEHLKRR